MILDQPEMDTTKRTGKLLFTLLGAIAEVERDLINERATEGRIKAKERGVKFGPPEKLDPKQVASLRKDFQAGKLSKSEVAEKYGISRATVYRVAAVAS